MAGYHNTNRQHRIRFETTCTDCESEITTVVEQRTSPEGVMIECACGHINWATDRTPLNEDDFSGAIV